MDAFANIVKFLQNNLTVLVITHNDRLKDKFNTAILVEKDNSHMRRLTKGGKTFRLYKFRSMRVNADRLLENDPQFKNLTTD